MGQKRNYCLNWAWMHTGLDQNAWIFISSWVHCTKFRVKKEAYISPFGAKGLWAHSHILRTASQTVLSLALEVGNTHASSFGQKHLFPLTTAKEIGTCTQFSKAHSCRLLTNSHSQSPLVRAKLYWSWARCISAYGQSKARSEIWGYTLEYRCHTFPWSHTFPHSAALCFSHHFTLILCF